MFLREHMYAVFLKLLSQTLKKSTGRFQLFFLPYYPWSPSQRPVGLPWLAKTSSVRFLVRSSKSWWLCLYKEIFNLYGWLQLPARRSCQRCVRFILFRNKNTQTFCYKSLLPWFLYHLKSTCIGLFHCKQIFRYCNDMNAKAIDF